MKYNKKWQREISAVFYILFCPTQYGQLPPLFLLLGVVCHSCPLTVEKSAQTITEEIYEHFDQITAVEPVYAIEAASGLSGYATSYDIGDKLCEEFAIDLAGATHALFYARFWRLKKDEKTYDNVLYNDVKMELLSSIREL